MSESHFLSRIGHRLRSRLRLSLLSLMVLIAAMALVSQYWLVPMLRQHAREATLKRIADIGGQWVDISARPLQKRLLLSGNEVDDELLLEIARQSLTLPELSQLDLFQTRVTDKGWNAFTSSFTQVKHMVIFENSISDKAIEATQSRRKDLFIERRQPDPVAGALAMAPIPPSAIISLISVDSKILAGAGDGRLHVLDADDQRPRRSLSMHENWLFDLALSPQGDLLASAGGDNQLALWSYPQLEPVARLTAHTGDLHGVVWLDDSHLATVSDDMALCSWELARTVEVDGKQFAKLVKLQSLVVHEKAIPRIRLSADRRTLVTAGRDDRLVVWSVSDDFVITQTAVLEGHTDDSMDVQIDPTGKRALSVGYDGALIEWELQSGRMTKRNVISKGRLFCLEMDWDHHVVLAGTPQGLIRLDLESGETTLTKDQPFVSRIMTKNNLIFTSDGFGNVIARLPRDLSIAKKATLYEEPYDYYSDDIFRSM